MFKDDDKDEIGWVKKKIENRELESNKLFFQLPKFYSQTKLKSGIQEEKAKLSNVIHLFWNIGNESNENQFSGELPNVAYISVLPVYDSM